MLEIYTGKDSNHYSNGDNLIPFYLICSFTHFLCLRRTCSKGSSPNSFSSESKTKSLIWVRGQILKASIYAAVYGLKTGAFCHHKLTFGLLEKLWNDFHSVQCIAWRNWRWWRCSDGEGRRIRWNRNPFRRRGIHRRKQYLWNYLLRSNENTQVNAY